MNYHSGIQDIFLAVLIGLSALIVFCGVSWLWNKWNSLRAVRLFPGPKQTFPFGTAHLLKKDGAEFYHQLLEWSRSFRDKGLFCLWFGPFHPFVFTFKPEFVEIILSSSRHISKSFEYKLLMPWLGTGLLTSTGEKWKTRRRLITPTFHFKILNDFIQVFENKSKVLVSILKSKCNEGTLNICPKITLCTLDIICETSMGKSVDAQRNGNSTYVNAIINMSACITDRIKRPWLWADWIYNISPDGRAHNHYLKVLHNFTNMVIDERISERKSLKPTDEPAQIDEFTGKRKRRRLAFLDLLIDGYIESQIDRQGIREEVDTFMFEGHDTTSAALSWAIMLLGQHPQVQQKAQEEVDAFFESRPEVLTVETLKDLKYLEYVIKESLRLYPSVPFFARTMVEDIQIDGTPVPKGATISVSPMMLHRNPHVWPDPERFDPDRFLPENSEGRHPYAYVPFSAGPRNCIGQRFALLEEKVVLAYVLHHFSLKSEMTPENIRPNADLISRPHTGIFVSLTPRN